MAHLRLFPSLSLSGRAAAHRAMARAALFSDSSTRTRLKRYNHHADKARALEAESRSELNRRVMAEWADGVEPGTFLAGTDRADRSELSPTARRRLMRAFDELRLEKLQGGES